MKNFYNIFLITLLNISVMKSSDFPQVVLLIDDDYPYQCVCTCKSNRTLGVCQYDSTTSCYCETDEQSSTTVASV